MYFTRTARILCVISFLFQGISVTQSGSNNTTKDTNAEHSTKTIDLSGIVAIDDDSDEAPDLMSLLDDDNWMVIIFLKNIYIFKV